MFAGIRHGGHFWGHYIHVSTTIHIGFNYILSALQAKDLEIKFSSQSIVKLRWYNSLLEI